MPATYENIATTTLGSNQASVTIFSSIPSTYTDLVLVGEFTSSTLIFGGVWLRFNGDSGTNYSITQVEGDGSSASSYRQSNSSRMEIGYNGVNGRQMLITNIMNYANTTTNKTSLSRYGNASNVTRASVGLWRSTSAITSITIGVDNQQIASGSIFTLYGIKAA